MKRRAQSCCTILSAGNTSHQSIKRVTHEGVDSPTASCLGSDSRKLSSRDLTIRYPIVGGILHTRPSGTSPRAPAAGREKRTGAGYRHLERAAGLEPSQNMLEEHSRWRYKGGHVQCWSPEASQPYILPCQSQVTHVRSVPSLLLEDDAASTTGRE